MSSQKCNKVPSPNSVSLTFSGESAYLYPLFKTNFVFDIRFVMMGQYRALLVTFLNQIQDLDQSNPFVSIFHLKFSAESLPVKSIAIN